MGKQKWTCITESLRFKSVKTVHGKERGSVPLSLHVKKREIHSHHLRVGQKKLNPFT
jgi:hypothetical protein